MIITQIAGGENHSVALASDQAAVGMRQRGVRHARQRRDGLSFDAGRGEHSERCRLVQIATVPGAYHTRHWAASDEGPMPESQRGLWHAIGESYQT